MGSGDSKPRPVKIAAWDLGYTEGVLAIARERKRQIHEKGHTLEADDKWIPDFLSAVGGMVATKFQFSSPPTDPHLAQARALVEHVLQKYRSDPIRRLAIAGALIAAEIDRLSRKMGDQLG